MFDGRLSLRTASRLIAVATAALTLTAAHLAWRATTVAAIGDDPVTIGVVTLRAPAPTPSPAPSRAKPRPAMAIASPPKTARGEGAAGDGVRLWWDGPAGEIVFRSTDRYERCMAARMAGREEPDCPGQGDGRVMVLASR